MISAGNGTDIVQGGAGNDLIDGGQGADLIDGGAGNDTIIASEGSDDVSGGAGNDVFVVHGSFEDVVNVSDSGGVDTLDFSRGVTGATINLNSGASSFVDGRQIIINGGAVTLPLDFVLLQDLSGSFSDDVATLEALVPDLTAALQAIQPDVRFGVASFVDKPTTPFGSSGDYVFQTDLALTSDPAAFQTAVNNLVVRDGGDVPEAQIEALMQLALRPAEIGFRAGALRAVVLTTDAPPHVAGDFGSAPPNDGDAVLDGGGVGEDYPTVAQLRTALVGSGIVPIFAVTNDVIANYQALVDELGFGVVVPLSSDSADIIDAIDDGLVSITATDIENAIGTDFDDDITGNALDNTINARAGNDNVSAGAGDDFVNGATGADNLNGDAGNDTLVGTQGSDNLSGGSGDDIYIVHGASGDVVTVTDDSGTDILDFSLGGTAATIDLHSGASSFVDGREVIINGGTVTLPLDFVLLQDLSGSFNDDIATLQALVPDLTAALQAIQPDVRFGVASFVDKPIGPFGGGDDYVFQTDLALTSDEAAFQTAVNNLVVRGGGDTPEAQIEALMQLALRPGEIGFRAGALRAVVISTDAEPHVAGDFNTVPANNGDAVLDGGGIGEDYPTVAQLRTALVGAGIVPIFAVTSDVIADYQALVNQLGFGVVVTLSSDSADIIDAIDDGLVSITTTDIEQAIGTRFNDDITGNDLVNVLDGRAGADVMRGEGANDVYIVDNAGDQAIETAADGIDEVRSSVSFTLGANVEHLTLTGSAAINGVGNALINRMIGNDAANTLTGLAGNDRLTGNGGNDLLVGGVGVDTMIGGAGDDRYEVDNLGDVLVEVAGGGIDTALSSISYQIGVTVENLTLTGTANINATGNSVDNVLTGNSGNNILNGGAGADTMLGGAGNDRYLVDNVGDVVTEAGAGGVDTIAASITSTISITIENLTLTGAAAINGTGNSGANILIGNSGANVLNAVGGLDTMAGGGGADTFAFTTALGAGNIDRITDFSAPADTIRLENAVFVGLGAGALAAGAFHVGAAAADAGDRIIYNSATGALFFDRDGTGAAFAAQQFAEITNLAALTSADFVVV